MQCPPLKISGYVLHLVVMGCMFETHKAPQCQATVTQLGLHAEIPQFEPPDIFPMPTFPPHLPFHIALACKWYRNANHHEFTLFRVLADSPACRQFESSRKK